MNGRMSISLMSSNADLPIIVSPNLEKLKSVKNTCWNRSGVTALRGNFHPFNDILVMPTFHPSYLVRNEGNRQLRKMVWEDMKKVIAFLGKK